jgi:hypothetical protein
VVLGLIVAVVIAVVIVSSYVFVLKRKPQVDADLYSSIYGGDFLDEGPVPGEEAAPAAEGAGLTPEQEALYGDDYGVEGGDYDEDYDYDYDDEDYDYEGEEEETPQ